MIFYNAIITNNKFTTNLGAKLVIALLIKNTKKTLYVIIIYKPPQMHIN